MSQIKAWWSSPAVQIWQAEWGAHASPLAELYEFQIFLVILICATA